MKRVGITSIFLLFLCPWGILSAQVNPPNQHDFELLIQQLFPLDELENEAPVDDAYESLFQYFMQPLDLNQANQEELQSLFLLTEHQIQSLFQHIQRNGPLLSIYELQAIPGWNLSTIQKILPFIQVKDVGLKKDHRTLFTRIKESGSGIFLLRHERVLQERKGYRALADTIPPAYLGSPDKIYARFRLNRPHDFSFGLTMEKDAGEPVSWRPGSRQYGADFLSFHAMLYNQGKFNKIVIGDFQLQYGQSLVFGSGFSIGKGAETITTVRRSNTGIRPYTSVLEFGFFRGASMTYQLWNGLEATVLYARAPRDAIIATAEESSELPGISSFSSLQQTGFHRTARELEAKGSTREQSAGGVFHYKSKNKRLQLGFTSLYTHFSQEWMRSRRLYNQFEFSGRTNMVSSIFGEYTWQNIHLFSELAKSKSGGTGLVAGTMISLSPVIDFSFLFRNYTPNFHSFYSTGFGEGSRSINEQGFYFGLKIKPSRQWWFTTYFDQFSFPWLRYRVDAPSEGYEYMLRGNFQPKKSLLLYAQYRQEVKELNSLHLPTKRVPLPGRKRNYLLNLDFSPNEHLSLRTRLQGSSYLFNKVKTTGYALVQDLSWRRRNLMLSGRMALFDTDDYNTRQYVYEKDVLWAFSIPAYYGRGIRNYLLVQYKFSKQISIWLRYALTLYTDREQISSGTEQIEGSGISQLKGQVRWLF